MVLTAAPAVLASPRPNLPRAVALLAALLLPVAACSKVSPQQDDSVTLPTFTAEVAMTAQEVDILVRRAAECVDSPHLVVAVVDRVGRPLALWRRNPAATVKDVNAAVALARTGAFMSSSQGPITSRTLAAISTFHFPATFGVQTDKPVPFVPTVAEPEFVLDPTLPRQRDSAIRRPSGQNWIQTLVARIGWEHRLGHRPRLATVGGLVDAAVAPRTEERARSGHEHHVRVGGVHDDPVDVARVGQPHQGEGFSAVGALVDPAAPRRALAVVRLAGADPHQVGVLGGDGDVAYRNEPFMLE